jgi:hypothetical protein
MSDDSGTDEEDYEPPLAHSLLEQFYKDLLAGIEKAQVNKTAHLHIPIEPCFRAVYWTRSFQWGCPLTGYIAIANPRSRVDLVQDTKRGGPHHAIWIGQVENYPGQGAGVLYGIDNDMLYLVLDEDADAFKEAPLHVSPWVSFSTLLNSPQDVS